MSAFYVNGEKKKRPGVYQQIVNIGKIFDKKAPTGGGHPGADSEITAFYDAETDTLSLVGEGLMVSYDGAGTVTIAGISHSYHDGTLTLGG